MKPPLPSPVFSPDVAPGQATTPHPIYQRLAQHYRHAMETGALNPGDRMPSVRALTRLHQVSLSTTLLVCRQLESEGWLEARPRSGYFVRQPRRNHLPRVAEPSTLTLPDPAQYVGIHDRISAFTAQCERHPEALNLAAAFGTADCYPGAALRAAAGRVLRQRPNCLVEPVPPLGDAHFRAVLARRALSLGLVPNSNDIIVTHGCIEALNLALRAVTQPGDTVAVESPAYFGLLQILESLGLRALEVATSPQTGLSVDALALALRNDPLVKAVVVVPNFQNPLGSVMPDAEKERLVALCTAQNIPLIEDDTYGALTKDDTPLKAAKAWDNLAPGQGQVIYCASLTKILAPGMRLGWMLGGRWFERIKMLKHAQSRPNDVLAQAAVASYMASSSYDRHLAKLRRRLHQQREQIAEAVAQHFPPGTRLSPPQGAMMLWIELPDRRSSWALFEAALKRGVRITPGTLFANSSRYDHFLRLSCGAAFTPEVAQAVATLGRIASDLPTGRVSTA